uniref:ADP,ATP carrier protein n=2 Tax=Odontella aurita TaxID=265563 RepID=A0A7S4J525_9STRA|mmetsp:Transcript_38674/g.116165  ORF Transcript_38674/g.116165 Transcript_38674/m.116165 type:complete len:417 (+) Transcript_38674:1105-2355(+)
MFALLSDEDQPKDLIAATMERIQPAEDPDGVGGERAAAPITFTGDPQPPIVLAADRKLVELPLGMEPRRPINSTDPFELGMDKGKGMLSNLAGLRFQKSKNDFLFPPVTKERTLGFDTYSRFFAAGAMASGFAHTALTPVDMLKTRLQTQPEKYTGGPVAAAATIVEEEGVIAFAGGLGPTAAGYFLAGSIAFGGTEILKRAAVDVLGPAAALANPFLLVLGCSAIAVATCALVLTPFEAARVRVVDDPDFAPSLPAALGRIVRDEGGIGGVYEALPALLVKEIPFHATKFAVFDVTSTALKASALADSLSSVELTLVAGVFAGIAAAIVSQPADATFTKCNQPSEADGRRLSPPEAFADLLENGGFGTGLSSRCLFGGALVSLQFLGYTFTKSLFHVTTGDLSLFLDVFSGLSLD